MALTQEVVITHNEVVADSTVEIDMTGYRNLLLIVEYATPSTGGFARAFDRIESGGTNIIHCSATNEKTSATTTNYTTLYTGCPPYMAVVCDWTDGKITVAAVKIP